LIKRNMMLSSMARSLDFNRFPIEKEIGDLSIRASPSREQAIRRIAGCDHP